MMVQGNLPAAMQGMVVVPIFAGYDLLRSTGRDLPLRRHRRSLRGAQLRRHRVGQPARRHGRASWAGAFHLAGRRSRPAPRCRRAASRRPPTPTPPPAARTAACAAILPVVATITRRRVVTACSTTPTLAAALRAAGSRRSAEGSHRV